MTHPDAVDAWEWPLDTPPCIICDYDANEPLGFLGPLVWYRCRACGMVYSTDAESTPPATAPKETRQ